MLLILSKIFKSIINTNCVKTLLEHFFFNSKDLIPFINTSFIEYCLSRIRYKGFFDKKEFGYTAQMINLIVINICKRSEFDFPSYEEDRKSVV